MQTASPCRDSSCITPPPFPNENYATVFIDYGRIPVTHLPLGDRTSADADLCVLLPGPWKPTDRCRVGGRWIPFPGCVRLNPGLPGWNAPTTAPRTGQDVCASRRNRRSRQLMHGTRCVAPRESLELPFVLCLHATNK